MSGTIIGLITGVIFFGVCYISTNNLIISSLPAVMAITYFVFFASPQINLYQKKMNYFRLTNQFVNNFIVSLSIQPVIDIAYKNAISSLNYNFGNKLDGTEDLNTFEKLRYLENVFSFHPYQVFVQIIDLWQEQGGDILKMSNFLINQFREVEEYISTCKRFGEKKVIEFSILWIFALSVLVVIRFALSQFYALISKNKIFLIGVISLFILVLISCQVLISKITKLELKGWKNHGK